MPKISFAFRRALLTILTCFCILQVAFSQTSGIDATKIAETYSNSIVKILLYDSLAEKITPGTGYIGRGSGFIVTDDGIIFTNRHVVDLCTHGYVSYDYYTIATKETHTYFESYSRPTIDDLSVTKVNRTGFPVPIIQVYSKNGDYNLYYAKVLMVDTSSFDGAILQIVSDLKGNPVTEKFHPVPIGNSDSTKQGEDLCIYGFPVQFAGNFDLMLNDQSTLTFGKHSGFDHVFNPIFGYIKTDASINGGNSGGPVFNSSNKVIGIATATGNKTGIGLLGGINAMYYVASADPSLLNKLSGTGLVKPQKVPSVSTCSKPSRQKILAGDKVLERYNKDKKFTRQFLRDRFTLKLTYAISGKEAFSVNVAPPMPFSVPVINMRSKSQIGFEIDKLIVLWRMKKNFELSLDWTPWGVNIINLETVSGIFPDSVGMPTVQPFNVGTFNTKAGLALSFLAGKRVFIDCYFKPDVYVIAGNEDLIYLESSSGKMSLGNQPSTKPFLHYMSHTGMGLTYCHFALGLDYKWGKSKAGYDYFVQYMLNGQPNGTAELSPTGLHKSNSIYLTLGYSFYKSTLKKLPSH